MSKTWPTTKQESDYMLMRQIQNIDRSKKNKAENWFNEKLSNSRYKFKRQRRWGYRIYDFWNHILGVAIEIDGWSHDPIWDAKRDKHDFERSRIIIVRVGNFNEEDAYKALEYIHMAETWNQRRTAAGMKPIRIDC